MTHAHAHSLSVAPWSKHIYMLTANKNRNLWPGVSRECAMEKRVLVKINKDKTELTLREVLDKIKELQDQHPEMDVFFDGDQYAICGRMRKAPD